MLSLLSSLLLAAVGFVVVVVVVMVVTVVVVVVVAALVLMLVLVLVVVVEFKSLIGIARLWPALAKRQERETWSLRWPQVFITRWTWHILPGLA